MICLSIYKKITSIRKNATRVSGGYKIFHTEKHLTLQAGTNLKVTKHVILKKTGPQDDDSVAMSEAEKTQGSAIPRTPGIQRGSD